MRGNKPLCCDCGIDTLAIDEFYMVSDDVWDQAWASRRVYHDKRDLNDEQPLLFEQLERFVRGEEILCIGCLEKRIGRTLCRADFTDVPINRFPNNSDRLRDRLACTKAKPSIEE
jgi:hypothetical protein